MVSIFCTEHFAINIFSTKDFSSIKCHTDCSAFPCDSPRVTLMDLLRAVESSGEPKIVIPCLSACLFHSKPALLASSKFAWRLWESFSQSCWLVTVTPLLHSAPHSWRAGRELHADTLAAAPIPGEGFTQAGKSSLGKAAARTTARHCSSTALKYPRGGTRAVRGMEQLC